MAKWESKSVADIVSKISEDYFVLPVIQRRLVWGEEQIELLFDTLLKGNPFGGIMVMEEEKGKQPMFAFRYFTKDGTDTFSLNPGENLGKEHFLVIDGQQRLQAFYIGLLGNINGKLLFFNLNSDCDKFEFDFKFAREKSKLPKVQRFENSDEERRNFWYSIPELFKQLRDTNDIYGTCDNIVEELGIETPITKRRFEKNIKIFFLNTIESCAIGLSIVRVTQSSNDDDTANKQRIVELFRRVNDGGTKLSSFDLVASILKGFEWEMESFLDEILKTHKKIGFGQDELIKLIFILQDNHSKEMINITVKDAKFAITHRKRIANTLEALEKFLHLSKLYEFYREGNQSAVPLYFIAYHIFHQEHKDDEIIGYFDTFDTNNASSYNEMYRWIYFSLLNGVFRSKGAGWIPYKTGVKKILEVVKNCKGSSFPTNKLFNVYKKHPLHFFETEINEDNFDDFDQSFFFYLMYDRVRIIRIQDVDHIHPQHLLENDIEWDDINGIANLQLLDRQTNRGLKSGKELQEWIFKDVEDRDSYLKKHFIPDEEELWLSSNFDDFIVQRQLLIVEQIKKCLQPG